MKAFDSLFPDVAKRDTRAIEMIDRAGRGQTFVFHEVYCIDPRCDCRHVVLEVEWIEGKSVAATIDYRFDRSPRRDEPQLFLDEMTQQGVHAADLLATFADMIAKDRAYRRCLIDHYAMCKQAGATSSRPAASARRKRPARSPRPQASVGSVGSAGSAGAIQILADAAGRTKSKLQQRFGRLLKQVDHLKQRVRAWRDGNTPIHRERAAYLALTESHQRIGHDLVCLFDRAYSNPIFSKPERKQLAALICEISWDLLADGEHQQLKLLYNRYSRSDFDAERAADDAAGASAMKSALEQMFDLDLGDADARSIDELRELAEAQMAEREAEREASRARRKRSAKQVAREAAREAEHAQVGKTLQEIYRKLAIALHPDLEPDPGERARKTELMQQVNVAYEAKDLLQLLELQLRFEQVDATKVDAIADQRLRHYIAILDEQTTQLEHELHELELPYRAALKLSPSARISPEHVVRQIRADAADLKQRVAMLRRDLDAFQDVRQLKRWLRQFTAPPRSRGRGAGAGLWG